MKYRRMTYTDRLFIERLYNSGCSYRMIAGSVGFSVAAVYREVQRGLYDHLDWRTYETVRRYSATIAHEDAVYQASSKGEIIKLGKRFDYAQMVSRRIRNGDSPDSIVGDLRAKGEWTVSTPTLYRYIDRGYIPEISNSDLHFKSRRKPRRYRRISAYAPNGPSIEHRPEFINTRSAFGHWEMDLVVGKGGSLSLLVLTERKTRYELISKLPDKTSCSAVSALRSVVSRFPSSTFQTITVDNGPEFKDYDSLKSCVQEVYYCHPYCSSERGSNENANGIIRRFLPKGTDFSLVTQKDCDAIANRMNSMHRKILGYKTASELFAAELSCL